MKTPISAVSLYSEGDDLVLAVLLTDGSEVVLFREHREGPIGHIVTVRGLVDIPLIAKAEGREL